MQFRYILLAFLLLFSISVDAVRPRMSVISSRKRDGYECRLIEFNTDRNERIRAYLLVPDSFSVKKLPAVVMLHDHGARFDIGKEKLVRPAGASANVERSSAQWAMKYFDGLYFGDYLASKGYVVLAADALYWGERSSEDARRWSCMTFGDAEDIKLPSDSAKAEVKRLKDAVYQGQAAVYDSLAAQGTVWAEKILQDDIASVKLLCSLPFVDRNRIGAFGFSMGAHRCWLLAAFSRRVKCGAAVSWMTLAEAYDSCNPSDLSMRIPSMRKSMDFPDIATMLRPKPMLFLSGDGDPLFPEGSVREAFSRMRAIYGIPADRDTRSPLETAFFSGGHSCGTDVQDAVADFFGRTL